MSLITTIVGRVKSLLVDASGSPISQNNPLPTRNPLRFDITGLASKGLVICEDDFSDGMCGFVALDTPSGTVNSDGRGAVQWDSRGAFGSGSIIARTVDSAANTGGDFAIAMAIKRMFNVWEPGRYLEEFIFSAHNSYADLIRPKGFTLGADTDNLADTTDRNLFGLDYNVVTDESGTPTPAWTWSIQTNTGNVTLGTFRVQTNENKDLPVYVAMEINTATGKWAGVRVNNSIRAGTLAAVPDNSLKGYSAPDDTLPTFGNGYNPYMQVSNRTNATKGAAEGKLHFHRTTYLGA